MTKPLPTKERIIDVAGDIFGKQGFKAATVRKIAKAAHANIASINYHFRDKQGLYRAVLEDIFSKGFQKFPSVPGPGEDNTPEHRLQKFIHSMVYRFLSDEGWQGISGRGKLIAREFLNPTPAFKDIVDTHISPQKDVLLSILLDLTGSREFDNSRDTLLPCALSIIGQCIYYAFATPIIRQIAEELTPTQKNLDRLSDHIFRFSLGGIQQINKDHNHRQQDGLENTREKLQ